MRYRQLGRSGLTVSVVGVGTNNFGRRIGPEETRAVVDAAIDAGVTLFDTADTYGGPGNAGASETLLGEILDGRRDQVVLATKFGMDMRNGYVGARGSRHYIRRAVEGSLRRLRTDHIDLYQYHRPDGITPMEETLAALDELVVEGKVRYIGSSNFDGWQIADAEWISRGRNRERFVSAQNEYNLLERKVEREIVPACLEYGVGLLPYFPLAGGALSGKYRRGEPIPEGTRLSGRTDVFTDAVFDKLEAFARFGDERGLSVLDVAIAGLAAQPAVGSVIAGATTPEQVKDNVAAGAWVLDEADCAALRALLEG